MSSPLTQQIRDILTRGRSAIDRMRLDHRLLRTDLREHRDEVLDALEADHRRLREARQRLGAHPADAPDALVRTALSARDAFLAKLSAARSGPAGAS